METGTQVRAVHHDGVLKLLDPLELPEGAEVSVLVLPALANQGDTSTPVELAHPTRLVSAQRLDALTDLVAVGGDALADSEALYESGH